MYLSVHALLVKERFTHSVQRLHTSAFIPEAYINHKCTEPVLCIHALDMHNVFLYKELLIIVYLPFLIFDWSLHFIIL
jgi:hypothetical protein